jgi:hypothetical protein
VVHVATFSWGSCNPCSVEGNAIAADGAHDSIGYFSTKSDVPLHHVASVRSSRPDVAQFTLDVGDSVKVVSGVPGETQLQLLDNAGKLIDQVTVTVSAVAEVTVAAGWTGAGPVILADTVQSLVFAAVDVNHRTLRGFGAIQYELTGSLVAAATPPSAREVEGISFTGVPGHGSIRANAQAAKLEVPITCVDVSAITGVVTSVQKLEQVPQGGVPPMPADFDITVTATSAAGAIYGAQCKWTVSDSSVLFGNLVNDLLGPAQSVGWFTLNTFASFTATCTLGSQTKTFQLDQ